MESRNDEISVRNTGNTGNTDWNEDIEDFVHECEVCRTRMYGLHCKIVCPNCGYKRDCSDP